MMKYTDLLNLDYYRYKKSSSDSKFSLFFLHTGFRFMFLFRLCNRFSKIHPLGIIARIWYKRMQVKYGFQIPHTTLISGGFFLAHFGNIIINSRTVIGENCNVAQGVTIGQINTGDKKGCPNIGNRVWIGPNAVVVGKVEIGDDVLIAPLSYVNFSVPAKSIVMGNPAKIVGNNGSTGYVNTYGI